MPLTLGKIHWVVIGALFLATPLFADSAKAEAEAENKPTYNWAYTEEASRLLHQIRSHSVRLADDTHSLNLHSQRRQLDWRSHGEQLDQISDHINAMGEKLDRLQEIHGMIAPWQQEAMNRIMPTAVALAAHTEDAIACLREQQDTLWVPPYTHRVSAMAEDAEEIRSTVSTFLEFATASDRLKRLERQIEHTGA